MRYVFFYFNIIRETFEKFCFEISPLLKSTVFNHWYCNIWKSYKNLYRTWNVRLFLNFRMKYTKTRSNYLFKRWGKDALFVFGIHFYIFVWYFSISNLKIVYFVSSTERRILTQERITTRAEFPPVDSALVATR